MGDIQLICDFMQKKECPGEITSTGHCQINFGRSLFTFLLSLNQVW